MKMFCMASCSGICLDKACRIADNALPARMAFKPSVVTSASVARYAGVNVQPHERWPNHFGSTAPIRHLSKTVTQVTAVAWPLEDGASLARLRGDVSNRTGAKTMRTTFIAVIAAVIALTAIWSAHVITAASPGLARSSPASSSIGVMEMMISTKTLPSEQYDAH